MRNRQSSAEPSPDQRAKSSEDHEIEIEPEGYWQLWSDYQIHRIHNRVLEHIQSEVEEVP